MAPSLVKMIVVLTMQQAMLLQNQKQIDGFDSMPELNPYLKQGIRNYMSDNIGYDDFPIAGVSRYAGNPVELRKVGEAVKEILPTRADMLLFELHVPSDMAATVSFQTLLEYSRLLDSAGHDQVLINGYLSMFYEKILLGYVDSDEEEMISFIPFLEKSRCKVYAYIDSSWNIGNFSLPGIEQIKLSNMHMF